MFNKIDRIEGALPRLDREIEGRERVWLSARDGQGVDLLRTLLANRFVDRRLKAELRLAPDQGVCFYDHRISLSLVC